MTPETTKLPSTPDIDMADGKAQVPTNPVEPDIATLRLGQDFAAAAAVKKALVTVPVRKPSRQEYVRVRAEPQFHLTTMVLELKEEREVYLVERSLWPALPTELSPRALYTTMSRQGVLSLWPVRLPGADGRIDAWSASALEAAQRATRTWVRVTANMALGAYDVFEATGDLPDPDWPEATLDELVRIAFRDRYITSLDHPVLRRLRGEL